MRALTCCRFCTPVCQCSGLQSYHLSAVVGPWGIADIRVSYIFNSKEENKRKRVMQFSLVTRLKAASILHDASHVFHRVIIVTDLIGLSSKATKGVFL